MEKKYEESIYTPLIMRGRKILFILLGGLSSQIVTQEKENDIEQEAQ